MTPDEQVAHLTRNADTVLPDGALLDKLHSGRPLRVKLGLDPTAPAVTLGWAVVLRKLREFQELGHQAVLIVGDFTAQVGDPSGKSETRKRLTADEVRGYAEALLEQFDRVLDVSAAEVRYNSEWLAPLDMADVLELTAQATVAQMLEREDFATRFGDRRPISVMEFMYPLLQGYDSVAIEADVELGGTDQLWNLMMGRHLQGRYGQEPQVALTMPLLVGTDGEHKMSQSLGNYVGVTDEPADMFGKVMSIPDHLMASWYALGTALPLEDVEAWQAALASGSADPNEAKRNLGREIVGLYHGASAARDAEAAFDALFKRGEVPDDVAEHRLGGDDPVYLPAVLTEAGVVASNGEARRLIEQGAVKVDGERVGGLEVDRARLAGRVVQVGKRRFVRLV